MLERLADRIRLVHVRDATVAREGRGGVETPFGEGDVDWALLLAAISGTDFAGPYVLRRRMSARPLEELAAARAAFKQRLPST
ncbi:MAG: sugar phosphate isomerase/epimerase [Planctomycetota bacterium]|nr:MAG: sugar phosphate isomerase/epimerase [Planctomycetota bacterium]